MLSLFELALAYTKAGISIIPFCQIGQALQLTVKRLLLIATTTFIDGLPRPMSFASGLQMTDSSAWRRFMVRSAVGWNVWI